MQDSSPDLYNRYLSGHFAHVSDQQRFRERKLAYYAYNYAPRLPAARSAPLLDIGPGFGEMLELWQRHGYTQIRAIDLSPEVVEHCNAIVPGSTTFVTDTTAYLSEHPVSFACITMLHILEHVPKPQVVPLLRAAAAALQPGGRLIIEVPNMAHPIFGLNVRYADFTHENGFTETSLQQVLGLAGFQRVSVFGTRLTPDRKSRIGQTVVQSLITAAIRVMYRAYGQAAPRVLWRSVSALAER